MNVATAAAAINSIQPCWSCKGPVAGRALFCSVCGAVQPPGNIDHFARLGMKRTFEVDQDQLKQQYFGFQRRLHPDRFSGKAAKERALSQLQATAINEAYEVLKDPLKRAAYLLQLNDHPVDISGSATITDPMLLMEQMEKREALEECSTPEEVAKVIAETDAEMLATQCHISAAFGAGDLDEAASLTTRLKYLQKLADEARIRKARLR